MPNSYTQKLSQTPILWMTFIATILCTLAFVVVAGQYSLVLVDGLSNPLQVRATIAAMTDEQRLAHAWITGTLDVLYPAVYGALFIGSAYKFFPAIARWLAAPIVLLIVVDLIEGIVQILALTGTADWLGSKAVITPLKMALFYFGLLVTIGGWIAHVVRRISASSGNAG